MQKIKRPSGEVILIADENETATEGATFKRKEWDYIQRLIKGHDSNEEKATFLNGCIAAKKNDQAWDIFSVFPLDLINKTEEILRPEDKTTGSMAIAEATINMLKGHKPKEAKPISPPPPSDENYQWDQLTLAIVPKDYETWIAQGEIIKEASAEEVNDTRKTREKNERFKRK